MPFVAFVIPSDSPGGWLNVHGVDREFGFYMLASPAQTTKFRFLGFQDDDTFRIRLADVTTNMRFNLKQLPGQAVSFEANGITTTAVQQNLTNPNFG